MQPANAIVEAGGLRQDRSIGRIVSVTGSKAILLLDSATDNRPSHHSQRPEMGTLLAIDTATTIVLAIVSALSVPVPGQGDSDTEIWIAELGLVGEIWKKSETRSESFNRGVTVYPALGDRVRAATKVELERAFHGDPRNSVRVGTIKQDATIPAMVKIDDLLGKHFAVLGTTGTGKSCTTALILRAILQKNPAAHMVLLDPHNEYSTAFGEMAEVISPRNMHLPYWLLNFEEIVEVLVGDSTRKPEIEILQELIPLAKGRYSTGRQAEKQAALRRGPHDSGRFTVDTPVPYRISDLTALVDERMGRLENKRDLQPYRALKQRIEAVTQDGRYAFMFGSLTVYDGMAQVLGRIFRVPVNGKPITILELTGLPTEVVSVVVSVLCRMTFDFALWSEGAVPFTLVCEEAHRYVPLNSSLGFEPCKRAIAKIAKEGRKYGASLCIVTQRPAEIDPTILSQCNTVFALRMSNDRDQAIVQSAIADTGSGLLEFLPALGQREAIAFGDGVALPVRIKFDELPKSALPRSSTASFTDKWQKSVADESLLEMVVEKWRTAGVSAGEQNLAMLAEAVGLQGDSTPIVVPSQPQSPSAYREMVVEPAMQRPPLQREPAEPAMAPAPRSQAPVASASAPVPNRAAVAMAPTNVDVQAAATAAAGTTRRLDALLRRDPGAATAAQPALRPAPTARRPAGEGAPAPAQAAAPAAPSAPGQAPGTFRSLRERLMSR
jgi:DNA helicase HerA-like ATPase